MSDRAYAQLWRVADGAVRDALRKHPDYLTPKGQRSARRSIVKRVTGTVLGFALQEAKRQRELAVTDDRSGKSNHQAVGAVGHATTPAAEAGAFFPQPIHSDLWDAASWMPKRYVRYRFGSKFAKTTAALRLAVDVDRLCFNAVAAALAPSLAQMQGRGRG